MAMKGKETENGMYEFPYRKPIERSAWETFRTSLWDPKTKTVFGRTGRSWVQLVVFYTLFYAGLACLFAICIQALFSTLNETAPKWQMEDGLIGSNPGLGFRPISDRTEEGSLIWYDANNYTTVQKWVNLTTEFLTPYLATSEGKNSVNCDFGKPPKPGMVCNVNLNDFGPCSPKENYGYNTSSPCIFLKLNRIYNWVPETYNDKNNLPEDMDKDLKERILGLPDIKTDQIWISCKGEHPVDREHVKGFAYYPNQGFPKYYYPYTNAEGYLSPLVAVQIQNPTVNVAINIECRAWAKNINYRGGNLQREGSVHFELMRDVV